MPQTMTRAQYDAGLDRLCDRYQNGATPAQAARLNEALATFKAGVTIVESVSRAPVRRAAAPTAKPAKRSKRAARIAQAVTETLTAAPKPATADVPLHQVDVDQLGALTAERLSAGSGSPFCRGVRESAPAAPVTETEAAATGRDLASLSNGGLDAVFDRLNQRRGFGSPLWRAA
jgi:hypothetical protein